MDDTTEAILFLLEDDRGYDVERVAAAVLEGLEPYDLLNCYPERKRADLADPLSERYAGEMVCALAGASMRATKGIAPADAVDLVAELLGAEVLTRDALLKLAGVSDDPVTEALEEEGLEHVMDRVNVWRALTEVGYVTAKKS